MYVHNVVFVTGAGEGRDTAGEGGGFAFMAVCQRYML